MDQTNSNRRSGVDAAGRRKRRSPGGLLVIAILHGLTGSLVGSLLGSSIGCDQGGGTWQKVVVEGAVTFDGKNVVNGDIRFIPTVASMGPTVGAEIIDGRFRVTNKGGAPVGTHRVVLRAFNIEGVGPATSPAGNEDLFGGKQANQKQAAKPSLPVYIVEGYAQFLPPAYNRDTALTVEITGQENPQIEDFNAVSVVP